MNAVGSVSVNTNYGSYSDCESLPDVSRETVSSDVDSVLSDSSQIGSFGSGSGSGELSVLYGQRARAESELGDITARKSETQSKVYARKQELTRNRQGGEEYAVENEALDSAQDAYEQTVSSRDKAQQELNQIKQESSANAQAISSNAQLQSSVPSQISSLQSQLASLKSTPNNNGGDNEESEDASSAAGGCENGCSALQSQIEALQKQLQQLKNEAAKLQNEKAQLDRELNRKQNEFIQLDTAVQVVQASLDEYYQIKADEDAGLGNDFAMDGELQELQSEFQVLQQREAEKQAELADINARLDAAEANDEELQTVRAEAADSAFQEAAKQTGFDAAEAETEARSAVAQDVYGKPYEELTDEEKLSIEFRVDGEVTVEAMDRARQILEEDPDNAAAQAAIERGAKNLDAQTQLAQTRFNNSMDNLPESLREGAAAAMAEARGSVGEGEDPEAAALEALTRYLADNSQNAALGPEELAALESISGAAGAYADALETADKGAAVVDKAADSFAKSDLAAMKADLAEKMGVSPDQLIVLSGTGGDDDISIEEDESGGLCVFINGEEHNYTAEEAKYLIIDGGAGNDEFWNDFGADSGFAQGLHIFGGSGNDRVDSFDGDNIIYGGSGKDKIKFGDGNNIINGGDGDDSIYCGSRNGLGGSGNNLIIGGAGNDWISCGEGNNIIYGGDGDDDIYSGGGNNYVDGGSGNDDVFIEGDGNNIILGGSGDDDIAVSGSGNNLLLGEDGNDDISGGGGSDIIDGGAGEDEIYGGQGAEDYAFTDEEDMVYLPNGQESLKIKGQPGITREFFDPEYVAGRLHVEDLGFEPIAPELGAEGSSGGGIIDKGKEIYGKAKPYAKPAFGVKKLYNGVKLPTSGLSKFMGVAGGLISVYGGVSDIVNGAQSGDGQKIVSGGLQALSGGLAIAAVCCTACPAVAAGLWIASGACQLASHVAEHFVDTMEAAALLTTFLLFEDEIRSTAFEDTVRALCVERYGDRLELINSSQP